MEERRLLLAIALSLLVLTAYQMLFPPPTRQPSPSPSPAASLAQAPAAAAPSSAPEPSPVAALADELERRVEVEGSDISLAFSNRGARLLSWRLAAYGDARGRPEEMVPAAPHGPRPLDIETGDAALDQRLTEVLFKASAETLILPREREAALSFSFADGELQAEKTLRFQGRGFLVGVEASVRRAGRELPVRLLWGPGIGNPSPEEKEVQGYQAPQGVALTPSGVQRHAAEKLGAALGLPAVRWVGVESRYFAALLVPPGGEGRAELRAVSIKHVDGKPETSPVAAVDLGSGGTAMVYVGPKDYQQMARLGYQLVRVVEVGDWIGPIVVPLMALLRWVHAHVGNYGWSIVVLTALINVLMSPLRHYSIANGIKMAKLAPEMRVIQERYRKVPALDPRRQEMQKEIAALYARHGMSMGTQMAVGCLPLLLTMPFLIAFYRVLQVSIELRGAQFLWISDLSQKDPLFLTPVLMGLSMLVMQKMTPSTMDPAQQRIMMLMPLMLSAMFLWAPAGLNLYWLASNLCSIVQQGVTLRLLGARDDKGSHKERRR